MLRIPFATLFFVFATSVHAAILTANDPTILGNGNLPDDGYNLTVDTETGYEWLDLSLSMGITYNTMISELGPGGMFEGFQHASNDDVLDLWTKFGLPTDSFPSVSSLADGGTLADSFIDIAGETGTAFSGTWSFTQGTTTSSYGANHVVLIVRNDGTSATAGNGGVGDGTAGAQIGHWLYRTNVPEPSTLVLLASGAVALLAWRRRAAA